MISGCGQKKEEPKTELETSTIQEITTTEASITTEEVIASGSGQDETVTSTTDAEEDNDVIEPLNDGSRFDPKFTGVSIFVDDFDRYKISSDILDYMYRWDINDECLQVDILEYDPDRYRYLMNITFKNEGVKKVEYFVYSNAVTLKPYEDDMDIGVEDGREY